MSDPVATIAILVARVAELEAEVARLTGRVRYNAEKQKTYRKRLTAARSNKAVTPAVSVGNEAVTLLPTCGNKEVTPLLPGPASPPHTPSLLKAKAGERKYYSPLADFVAASWPEKPLTEEQERAWRAAYPGVDLLAEAKNARAWQLEDLQRRTRPRAIQFLGNWLRTAQQRMAATPTRPRGAALQINPKLEAEEPGRKFL